METFLLKQSVSIEKKGKNCAWSKVFLSLFYKVLPKQMCFSQYFNMCMEKFYKTLCFGRKKKQQELCLIKSVSVNIFIKFYQNKCVLVNILICAWKNSTKTLCFGRKKTARTVLDQKCFCHIFIKFYWNKCVSVNILICACTKKNSIFQNTLFWYGKKNSNRTVLDQKCFCHFFIKFYQTNVFQSIF